MVMQYYRVHRKVIKYYRVDRKVIQYYRVDRKVIQYYRVHRKVKYFKVHCLRSQSNVRKVLYKAFQRAESMYCDYATSTAITNIIVSLSLKLTRQFINAVLTEFNFVDLDSLHNLQRTILHWLYITIRTIASTGSTSP